MIKINQVLKMRDQGLKPRDSVCKSSPIFYYLAEYLSSRTLRITNEVNLSLYVLWL